MELATATIMDVFGRIEKAGRLTPSMVVAEAENPECPIHDYFEWDDAKAGHAYRIEQARILIRRIKIEVETIDSEDMAVKVQVSNYVRDPVRKWNEEGYVSLEQIRREPENAKLMVIGEFVRAEANLKRAKDLAKVLGEEPRVSKAYRTVKKTREYIESTAVPPPA